MAVNKCCVCGNSKTELRPYGPEGAPICFKCGTSPEREAETERQFQKRLKNSDPIAVLTSDGPKPWRSSGNG